MERTVRPSPDGDAIFVELGILGEQLAEGGELVAEFDRAELVPDRGTEFPVAVGRAAVIDREDRESFLQKDLMEEAGRPFPGVTHQLCGGSPVDVDDHGDFSAGLAGGRNSWP